jgi:hypothetical protein
MRIESADSKGMCMLHTYDLAYLFLSGSGVAQADFSITVWETGQVMLPNESLSVRIH